jgi:DNA-binding MarR family transcriptional regulator
MEYTSNITIIKWLAVVMEQTVNQAISEQDLTMSQGAVLFQLVNAPEGILSLKELERKVNLSQPVALGIVKRLEEKGFVVSTVNPKDRRAKNIQITEPGRQHLAAARAIMDRTERDLFAGMSPGEIGQFRNTMLHLLKNMENPGQKQE